MKGRVLVSLVLIAVASMGEARLAQQHGYQPAQRLRAVPAPARARAPVGINPMSSAEELEELAEIKDVVKPGYVVGGYDSYAMDYPLIQEGSPGPKIAPPPRFTSEGPNPTAAVGPVKSTVTHTPGAAVKPQASRAAKTHQMPALAEVRQDDETTGAEAGLASSASSNGATGESVPAEQGKAPTDTHNAGVVAGAAQGKLEDALVKGQQDAEKTEESLDERLTTVEKKLVSISSDSEEIKEAESKDAEASSKAEETSATLEERVEENTKKMNELEGMVKEMQAEITAHFNETESEGAHGEEEGGEAGKEGDDKENDGSGEETSTKEAEGKTEDEPTKTENPAVKTGAAESSQSSPSTAPTTASQSSSNPGQGAVASGNGNSASEGVASAAEDSTGDEQGDSMMAGGMVDESGDEDISSEPEGVGDGMDGEGMDGEDEVEGDGEVASAPAQNPPVSSAAGGGTGAAGAASDSSGAKTGNDLKEAIKPKAKIRPSKPAVAASSSTAGANTMGMGVAMPMMGSGLNERVGAVGMMGDSISRDSAEMQAGLNALDSMDFAESDTPALDVADTDMTLSGQLYGAE